MPDVDIVFDKFHVIALMNKVLDEMRREISRDNPIACKGTRFLLLKNYDSLEINGMERLNTLLSINKPLFVVYSLKEQLRSFWNKPNTKEAAKELDKKPVQIALAWLLHNKNVSAVIVGARKTKQLTDSLEVGEFDLPDGIWKMLDEAAHFDRGYPQAWYDLVHELFFKE